MQPRLARSNTEKMIAGVCGGLSEYFAIDPVIVRLIFVLVASSGLSIPTYIVLWVLMPRSDKLAASGRQSVPRFHQEPGVLHGATPQTQHGDFAARSRQQAQYQRAAQAEPFYHRSPWVSSASLEDDPQNRQPWQQHDPATGPTIRMSPRTAQPSISAHPAPSHVCGRKRAHCRGRNWRTLGFILMGIGGLIMLEHVTGSFMAFVFPILLIGTGVYLLKRANRHEA